MHPKSERGRLQPLASAVAFLLTGVGTALLGAALPAMLAEWHLSDRSGGWLLFSSFAGSTLGALLVREARRWLAAVGLACSAAAMLLLSRSSGGVLIPSFCLYGLGLGLTMTALSLLRAREVPAAQSNLEMNRLNLLWAIGACCAPALALRSLHTVSVSALFRFQATLFLAVAAFLAISGTSSRRRATTARRAISPERLVPLRFCLFAAAAVGIESAIGGWLTTYTQRLAHGAALAVSANSAFWLGLLASRAAHSWSGARWLRSRPSVALHVVAVAAATTLLIALPFGAVLPAAALLAGVGLGPLYALALSLTLPYFRANLIFVICGFGSSLLPWLTGAVSTSFGSLRAGLLAPGMAVVVLVWTGLSIRQELPKQPG